MTNNAHIPYQYISLMSKIQCALSFIPLDATYMYPNTKPSDIIYLLSSKHTTLIINQ